ncbi:hypothetical protein BGX28_002522 [Mortierella sp. GBA30]|nr:hypothetical protein BGX28_002522 [Mortierella sp. GBA30]
MSTPPTLQPKLPPILPPPGSVPGTGSGSGFVSGIEAAAASALTLANNIAFRPMTTQPAKCSKLKIRIYFDSTIFQAGGNLFGRMEVTATSSRSLKLGEIAVELAAYEGPNIPPSNAVHGPADEDGFWMAKKGKTTFPFAFQLPLDCPSSLVFGQTASLRYVVTGLVQVFYHGKDETILKSKEAFVVEAWDGYNPDYKLPVQASNSTKLFWGGSGSLVLHAMLSEGLHSAGGNLSVEVKVKNNTSRKVQGIRIGVSRRLEMVSDKAKVEQNPGQSIDTVCISEVIGAQEFKSSSYLFDTGEERAMTINMAVPGNARTIRGTALFEVTCFVVVSMLLGAFSGELSVEIPVKICHPASLTPAPRPKLDQNHLPHHYNLVDEDLEVESDGPTRSNRRTASNSSLASPITGAFEPGGSGPREGSGRQLPWGSEGAENDDEGMSIGRQGEWKRDERELSPANSITSIRSLLSSPKQKLSRLADKIQRSTSPSSSNHLGHEHRQAPKNQGDSGAHGRRHMMAKSPPLGPALPIAYVPAVERVRYTPFQPPPTTKAKEFLKAAAQYQQEMALGGALSGFGDDNVEFDLDDKKMASAIHQWISKKESEGMYQAPSLIQAPTATRPTPPIQIPIATSARRRPTVGPIDTHVGSFSSQHSPTGASPQSYYSPVSPGDVYNIPTSHDAASYSNQTTSRFLHHAHRQPAAPQTAAFGSAPEDCVTNPPLFARPLPLPSPPPTGSPLRPGMNMSAQPRSVSPVPVPIQTPENLALAREAFERVKRVGSPVQDSIFNAATSSSAPEHTTELSQDPKPTPIPTTPTSLAASPSGLSQLLNGTPGRSAPNPKHARDGHSISTQTALSISGPDLGHVSANRPLPIPGPKPHHLNTSGISSSANQGAQPSGYKFPQQPSLHSTSLHRTEPTKRSAHKGIKEQDTMTNTVKVQQNAYVPKPTPTPSTKPLPAKIMVASTKSDPTGTRLSVTGTKKAKGQDPSVRGSDHGTGSGFVYPKAARKPVPTTKPAVAVKPKRLAVQPSAHQQDMGSNQTSSAAPVIESGSHDALNQRPRRIHQEEPSQERLDITLAPTASMRAPQLIPVSLSQSSFSLNERRSTADKSNQPTHVTLGFESTLDMISVVEETEEDIQGTENVYREESELAIPRGATYGNVQYKDLPEQRQQTQSEIRAQAVAAANSFRATGANIGGYIVNTGKLRQVIKDGNGGGGNGHLIQALADGAMNAASAAASGLGWRQQQQQYQSPHVSSRPANPRPMQQRHQQQLKAPEKRAPLSRGQQHLPEHPHDLTMKDIHFQTLTPGSNQQVSIFDSAPEKIEARGVTEVQLESARQARSHHLFPASSGPMSLAVKQQSQSQPGSRVMYVPPRNEPLPPRPVALAVEARPSLESIPVADNLSVSVPTESFAAAVSSPSPPNLDKTLPKIQEPTPKSRVFERPEKVEAEQQRNSKVKVPSVATTSSVGVYSRPGPRSRFGEDSNGETTPAYSKSAAGVIGSAAPKVINPRLQEYIQKYNLAASTRP